MYKRGKSKGQSLVEVLIAISIGGLIIGSSVIAITLSLRSNVQNEAIKNANFLLYEMIDSVRSVAEGDWNKLYSSVTKATPAHVVRDNGGLILVNGTEGVPESDAISGLVGYWKFDEASGDIAYDFSANGNKGTFTNGPLRSNSANCKSSTCVDFDGIDDYITFDPFTLTTTNALSISTWVNMDDFEQAGTIIGQQTQTNPFVWFFIDTAARARFQYHDGSTFIQVITTDMLSDKIGTWNHVAVTADYSTGVVRFYLNGIFFQEFTGLTMLQPNVDRTLNIGAYSASSHRFDGKMDNLAIYNKVLSETEVSQIYGSRIYSRSFSAENVNRNSTTGEIVSSGGSQDPSTQKITGTITWPAGSTFTTVEYLTRTRNEIERITDWSDSSTYESANLIDATTPGEIKLILE